MRAWLAGVGVTGVAVWLRSRRNREERRAQVQAFETQAHGPYTAADIEAMKWDD